MPILTKENFIEFLIKRDVYQSYLTWAKAQVSARDIVEKCPNVNHLQWLIEAIGGPMQAEYLEKLAQLRAEYDKKEAKFWAEYWEKIAPIRAEYEHNVVQLWGKYDKKEVQLDAEFNKKHYTIVREICTFERVQEAIGS